MSSKGSEQQADLAASSTMPEKEDPLLLKTVVEETLRLSDDHESALATIRAAILEVGQKYGGEWELSPAIVLDLVQSVLVREMPALAAQPPGRFSRGRLPRPF